MKNHGKRYLYATAMMLSCCLALSISGCKAVQETETAMEADEETGVYDTDIAIANTPAFTKDREIIREDASGVTVSIMEVAFGAGGVTAADDGGLVVTDVYNKQVWHIEDGNSFVLAGKETVKDLFGQPVGGYNDSDNMESFFAYPVDISPFLGGYAVSDRDNNALRLISEGRVQTLNGFSNEKLKTGEYGVIYDKPTGLTTDDEGNLYISDTGNGAIRMLTTDGRVSTVMDGLNEPTGIFYKDGSLYVADAGSNQILKITDKKIEILAGSGENDLIDGDAEFAAFSAPLDLAVGEDDTIYVADTSNAAIRQIKNGKVTTLMQHDAAALELDIEFPCGMYINENELYVCDSFSRKLVKITLQENGE